MKKNDSRREREREGQVKKVTNYSAVETCLCVYAKLTIISYNLITQNFFLNLFTYRIKALTQTYFIQIKSVE